jgi:alpha 1,3-glucosidase
MRRPTSGLTLVVLLLSVLDVATAVKHADFKTCVQSGFCRRNRALADQAIAAGPAWTSPYELETENMKLEQGVLTGTIWKTVDEKDGGRVELPLTISLLDDGVARVTIDEAKRRKGEIELRGDSKANKERYNEAEKWVLVGGKNVFANAKLESLEGESRVSYGFGDFQVVLQHKPFKVTFMRNGEAHIVLNERNFMNFEHWRPQREKKEGEQGEDESTWWDETFGGNTDSKPRGWYRPPSTVQMCIDLLQGLSRLPWILRFPATISCTVFPSMPPAFL